MTDFFMLFVDLFKDLLGILDTMVFEFMGYEVSVMSIIFVFLFFGLVINVFWRGAKT